MRSLHHSLAIAAALALTAGSLGAQPFADLSGWTIVAGDGLVTPQTVNLGTAFTATSGCPYRVFTHFGSGCSAAQSPHFATSGGTLAFALRFNSEETEIISSSAALIGLREWTQGVITFPVNLRSTDLVGGTSGIVSYTVLLGAGVYEMSAVLERRHSSPRNSSLVITNLVLPPAPVVPTPVPERATVALVGAGLLAVGGAARRGRTRPR